MVLSRKQYSAIHGEDCNLGASVTCVFTWAKAVPCVADSVLLLMLYFRTLLDQNTSELFITVNDEYQQQLTTKTETTDT